jgi:hypothetical protein
MNDWKHVSEKPKRAGEYAVCYHEDFLVGEEKQAAILHWDMKVWHLRTGERAAFGNHNRKDIQDHWREVS